MKIAILGFSGSGKSTLAKQLAAEYGVPILHLDTVQFEANWQARDQAQAISMVERFMEHEEWVIDGNYDAFLQKERLEQADQIIYLAFNRFNCLLRACKRYYQCRGGVRTCMAPGCAEKIDIAFVWWILHKGRTGEKKRHYKQALEAYRTKLTIIKNQRQLDAFMRRT